MDTSLNGKLIDEVSKHRCIYDLFAAEYRNVEIKRKAWKDIGAALNVTDEVCQRRWKTLRDSYKRHMRSVELTGDSGAPSSSKKFKFSERMSFLPSVRDCKSIEANIFKEVDVSEASQKQEDEISIEAEWMDSTALENLNSTSCTTPIYQESSKKYDDAVIKTAFNEIMETCYGKISEIASSCAPIKVKNSTLLLFESLANKITSAALLQEDVDLIEARVVSVVYEEIAKRRRKTN